MRQGDVLFVSFKGGSLFEKARQRGLNTGEGFQNLKLYKTKIIFIISLKAFMAGAACPEEIEAPAVLPYLRRQAITAAMRQRRKSEQKKLSFWESQKLAFNPLKYTMAYLPGGGQLRGAAATAVRGLPELLANSLSGAGRLWKKNRGR